MENTDCQSLLIRAKYYHILTLSKYKKFDYLTIN